MTLQQLRLFEAVARHKSFTRAAEEVYLTQPAVSIQIKRLEERLGLPLFEQVGKQIYLTGAGRELYAAAREVLERLESVHSALKSLRGEMAGPLRLAVVSSAKYFLPHILGDFLRRYPRVEPYLQVTNRERALIGLAENQQDLYIMGQVPDSLEVECYPFLENVLVAVACPNHPLAEQRAISLERLAEEHFLVREPGSGTRIAVEQLLANHGIRITPYMELGSGEAIKQGVMADLGLAVISLHSLRLELATGLITVLDVEGFPLHRRWYAVHRKGKKLSRVAQGFLDFLQTEGEQVVSELLEMSRRNLPLKGDELS